MDYRNLSNFTALKNHFENSDFAAHGDFNDDFYAFLLIKEKFFIVEVHQDGLVFSIYHRNRTLEQELKEDGRFYESYITQLIDDYFLLELKVIYKFETTTSGYTQRFDTEEILKYVDSLIKVYS